MGTYNEGPCKVDECYSRGLKASDNPPEVIYVEVMNDEKTGVLVIMEARPDIEYFAMSPKPRIIAEYKLVGRRSVKLPIEVKEI